MPLGTMDGYHIQSGSPKYVLYKDGNHLTWESAKHYIKSCHLPDLIFGLNQKYGFIGVAATRCNSQLRNSSMVLNSWYVLVTVYKRRPSK